MRRLRELLFGGLVAAAGTAAALLILEGSVRLLHLVPDRFWQPDPVLGMRPIPGKEGWWTQEEREFVVPVRMNREGFRDVEHAVEAVPGAVRILLLGDSFVEALQVPLEQTLGRQLERRLQEAGLRAEVISMGVSAYGTAGELLLYRRHGRRYRPDLVLLAFYPGNDVRNNSPELESVLVPEYGPDGDVLRLVARQRPHRDGGGLRARSQLYRYVRKLVLTRHPDLAARLAEWGWIDRRALERETVEGGVPLDYGVYAVPADPRWERAWEHTERMLDRLAAEIAAAGSRFALVVVAGREQVEPGVWEEILAANPAMRARRWDLEAPARRVLGWCARRGVACLDLTPGFRAGRARDGPLHFRYDGHWNAAGHAMAAELTAVFVRRVLADTGHERRESG